MQSWRMTTVSGRSLLKDANREGRDTVSASVREQTPWPSSGNDSRGQALRTLSESLIRGTSLKCEPGSDVAPPSSGGWNALLLYAIQGITGDSSLSRSRIQVQYALGLKDASRQATRQWAGQAQCQQVVWGAGGAGCKSGCFDGC